MKSKFKIGDRVQGVSDIRSWMGAGIVVDCWKIAGFYSVLFDDGIDPQYSVGNPCLVLEKNLELIPSENKS